MTNQTPVDNCWNRIMDIIRHHKTQLTDNPSDTRQLIKHSGEKIMEAMHGHIRAIDSKQFKQPRAEDIMQLIEQLRAPNTLPATTEADKSFAEYKNGVITIKNCIFKYALNFSYISCNHAFHFQNCVFEDHLRFDHAQIAAFSMDNVIAQKGLDLSSTHTKSVTIKRSVMLAADDEKRVALNAEAIDVSGCFRLYEQCIAVGKVYLRAAKIGGVCEFHNAILFGLEDKKGRIIAINTRTLAVGSDFITGERLTVNETKSQQSAGKNQATEVANNQDRLENFTFFSFGISYMENLNINGSFICNKSYRVGEPQDISRARIAGSFNIRKSRIYGGKLILENAYIKGIWGCSGSEFYQLNGKNAEIDGDVFFDRLNIGKSILMHGATMNGSWDCRDMMIVNTEKPEGYLGADGIKLKSNLLFGYGERKKGDKKRKSSEISTISIFHINMINASIGGDFHLFIKEPGEHISIKLNHTSVKSIFHTSSETLKCIEYVEMFDFTYANFELYDAKQNSWDNRGLFLTIIEENQQKVLKQDEGAAAHTKKAAQPLEQIVEVYMSHGERDLALDGYYKILIEENNAKNNSHKPLFLFVIMSLAFVFFYQADTMEYIIPWLSGSAIFVLSCLSFIFYLTSAYFKSVWLKNFLYCLFFLCFPVNVICMFFYMNLSVSLWDVISIPMSWFIIAYILLFFVLFGSQVAAFYYTHIKWSWTNLVVIVLLSSLVYYQAQIEKKMTPDSIILASSKYSGDNDNANDNLLQEYGVFHPILYSIDVFVPWHILRQETYWHINPCIRSNPREQQNTFWFSCQTSPWGRFYLATYIMEFITGWLLMTAIILHITRLRRVSIRDNHP